MVFGKLKKIALAERKKEAEKRMKYAQFDGLKLFAATVGSIQQGQKSDSFFQLKSDPLKKYRNFSKKLFYIGRRIQ